MATDPRFAFGPGRKKGSTREKEESQREPDNHSSLLPSLKPRSENAPSSEQLRDQALGGINNQLTGQMRDLQTGGSTRPKRPLTGGSSHHYRASVSNLGQILGREGARNEQGVLSVTWVRANKFLIIFI